MISWIDRIKKILRRMPFVDFLFDMLNSVLTLQETGGEHTPSNLNVEEAIYLENSPLGVFRPLRMYINLDNMIAGDTIEVREYYRIDPAGNLELADYATYTGIDGGLTNGKKLIVLDLTENRYGFKVTLEQTAGTERAYTWEYIGEA